MKDLRLLRDLYEVDKLGDMKLKDAYHYVMQNFDYNLYYQIGFKRRNGKKYYLDCGNKKIKEYKLY